MKNCQAIALNKERKPRTNKREPHVAPRHYGRNLANTNVHSDQVIRENPASRGTETSAEVLVGPPLGAGGWSETPVRNQPACKSRINKILPLPQMAQTVGMDVKKTRGGELPQLHTRRPPPLDGSTAHAAKTPLLRRQSHERVHWRADSACACTCAWRRSPASNSTARLARPAPTRACHFRTTSRARRNRRTRRQRWPGSAGRGGRQSPACPARRA